MTRNCSHWTQPECPAQEQGTLHLTGAWSFEKPSAVTAGSVVWWGMKRKAPTCEVSESAVYIKEHVHGAWKETRSAQPSHIGECSFTVSYFLKITIFKEARIT